MLFVVTAANHKRLIALATRGAPSAATWWNTPLSEGLALARRVHFALSEWAGRAGTRTAFLFSGSRVGRDYWSLQRKKVRFVHGVEVTGRPVAGASDSAEGRQARSLDGISVPLPGEKRTAAAWSMNSSVATSGEAPSARTLRTAVPGGKSAQVKATASARSRRPTTVLDFPVSTQDAGNSFGVGAFLKNRALLEENAAAVPQKTAKVPTISGAVAVKIPRAALAKSQVAEEVYGGFVKDETILERQVTEAEAAAAAEALKRAAEQKATVERSRRDVGSREVLRPHPERPDEIRNRTVANRDGPPREETREPQERAPVRTPGVTTRREDEMPAQPPAAPAPVDNIRLIEPRP
ncbi:MAG: hypothetical protein HY078_11680 [Elusimicrobia bacterium]|nr:hypothetical protein [Elusimicrobiota bacterium]